MNYKKVFITTRDEITLKFGGDIATLVEANSFDKKIKNKIERYKENFSRCVNTGKDTLIIKAVDIFDNADYCCFDKNGNLNKWWVEKMRYFIKISKDILQDEPIYIKLKRKYDTIVP